MIPVGIFAGYGCEDADIKKSTLQLCIHNTSPSIYYAIHSIYYSGILCNTKIADLALVVRNTDVAGGSCPDSDAPDRMTKLFQNDCVRFGHRKYALDYLATVFNAGMNAPLRDETNVRMAGILEETFIVSRLPTVTV